VTVYELEGQVIPDSEVAAGLAAGKYVLVGDKISTVIPASTSSASTPTPTPIATTSSAQQAAQFIEVSSSSTTSATPVATTSAAPVESAPASTEASSAAPSTSADAVNKEFKSGMNCTTFPSEYGAVYIDWLELGGWTGLQYVPNYSPGASSISTIETKLAGSTCGPNMFCSYACPAGYQKSQWPDAQGSTLQSIGGLYCNSEGKLELSRATHKKLCVPGAGGVQIKNSLNKNVAVCRTDYPGLEAETIPVNTQPGQSHELCNPDANDYYIWNHTTTTAQYYINPAGAKVSDACVWGSAGTDLGNWAPVNAGVGKDKYGITYVSLFQNSPTNPSGVLDFNIRITGDIHDSCSYSNGVYYQGGVPKSGGCTVATTGNVVYEFY
jgi:hypothetical protein